MPSLKKFFCEANEFMVKNKPITIVDASENFFIICKIK